ncbi:MAG: endonuclease/exonuclease/phosphatase family protein [Saprospiraceae bacterium]
MKAFINSATYGILLFLFITINHTVCIGQQAKITAIGFYNLENLFDTENDTLIEDEEFLPTGKKSWTLDKYQEKSKNMADVISKIATDYIPAGLSILGVSEIENRKVLEDLVKQPSLISRNYQIVHLDSPDFRGIDVGLLYNPVHFTVMDYKPIPLINIENGKRKFTRDILYVKGILDQTDTLHILVNHWPSRSGGEKQTAAYRNNGGKVCRQVYDSLLLIHKNVHFIVMGDLNDNPDNESITSFLRAKANKKTMENKDLFNPYHDLYRRGLGSNAYRDTWSLFDQIIISDDLMNNAKGYKFLKAQVFNKEFLTTPSGKYKGYPFRTFDFDNYQGGYSDHFPAYIYLVKEVK